MTIKQSNAKWRCVKCGNAGQASQISFLPAAPDARPRWQKFVQLITCPDCGDDKGHCGILSDTGFEPQTLQPFIIDTIEPSPFALRNADLMVREILDALPIEEAINALQRERGYDASLAIWLSQRGIRFSRLKDLRFKVSASTFAALPNLPDSEPLLWLPVVTYPTPEAPMFAGLQVRRLSGEPRYLTCKFANAPLAHVALPTDDRTDGQRWGAVWLTEGILKAEIVAFKLGCVAIGALGTGALKQATLVAAEAARRWHKDANLFNAPIILAPDSDARNNLSVAKAFWRAKEILEAQGFSVMFAVWSPQFKGIDDALLAGETPTVVAPETWLATLQARIRDQLLQVKVRPRLLLDGEIAQAIDLPESVLPSLNAVTQVYEAVKRKETWLQALTSQSQNGKAAIVVDRSPTGSGKTYAAARLKVSELRKAGLFVKRLVYISPEVKRSAVKQLERFRLFVGRDELCPFWERLQQVEAEGLTKVGKRVCAHCPVKQQCAYYAQKQSGGRRYWRISWQSYSPKEGDFLVLDEFSRLPLWRDFTIAPDQFADFLTLLDRFGAPEPILDACKTLNEAIKRCGSLTHNEVAQLFSAVEPHQWNAFAHDLQVLLSDIRKVRAWVFKQTEQRPTWFGWAQAIVDIFRGHNVGQVWVEQGSLKVKVLDSKLKEATKKASAILVLDATIDPAEVERLLEAPVTVVRSDEPEKFPTVLQVPLGALSHRARPEAQRRWLWTAKQVVEALQRKGLLPPNAKIGVLTHKSAAEFAQQIFGKSAVIGWFGRDDRGSNAYFEAGVTVLVCVGLPHRNVGTVAAERLRAGERQRTLRKVRLDPQGYWWTVLKEFADPELAATVRREAAVAYLQAAGRLRQGRRSEPCYLVVLDTEPLPEALNPVVIPPEKVLPTEVWQDWQRRRQRGAAVINALRQKTASEKLAKAAEVVGFYREIIGTDPKPAWLAQVLRVHRNWARKLLAKVSQTAHYIREKDKETEGTVPIAQMKCAVCDTLEDAIRAFLAAGYPIPVRALARRFNTNDNKVRRLARRLKHEHPVPSSKFHELNPFDASRQRWLSDLDPL